MMGCTASSRRKRIRSSIFHIPSFLVHIWKSTRHFFLSLRQTPTRFIKGTLIFFILAYLVTMFFPNVLQANREYLEYVPRVHGYSHRLPYSVNMTKLCEKAKAKQYLKVDVPSTLCTGYVLNSPHICRNAEHIFSLIVVNSAPNHFVRRQRMRLTVGNSNIMPASVRIVFLLGFVSNATLQTQLIDEHIKYGDTVQGSFMDTYRNLTLKAVMGLKWITENCQNTEFVIRMDDDASANMYFLLNNILSRHIGRNKTLFCLVLKNSRIHRHTGSKWFVNESRFEKISHYPWTYCIGWALVLSSDLIPRLYERAVDAPTFWIDDIYVTGILVDMLKPVKFYDIHMDMEHGVMSLSHDCFQKSRVVPCLFINSQSEFIHRKFWDFIYKDRYNFGFRAIGNLDLFEGL